MSNSSDDDAIFDSESNEPDKGPQEYRPYIPNKQILITKRGRKKNKKNFKQVWGGGSEWWEMFAC